MHYEGDLTITADNAADFAELVSITGSLHLRCDILLAALKEVDGRLTIHATKTSLPSLVSVGRDVIFFSSSSLSALESIGGFLHTCHDTDISLPALVSIGIGIFLNGKASLPSLASVSGIAPLPPSEQAHWRAQVARHALADTYALDMSDHHSDCGTSHCIAGWAEELMPKGLFSADDPAIVGWAMLGTDAAQYFNVTDDEAREYLQTQLPAEAD